MRLILVPTAARPESLITLNAAFALAGRLGANVAGCHVRGERHESPAPGIELTLDPTRYGIGSVLTSKAARKAFVSAAEQHGFELKKAARAEQRRKAYWHELVGTPARMFAIAGTMADVTVLVRPKPKSSGRGREFLLAALLHSARPVLVLPQRRQKSVGERVLIAWNQSADAALAVSAAIPLLARAESVVVASCGPENRTGPKSRHLAQYLANWDVRVERVSTKGRNVERELETVYRDTRSDLLVMGAYSRSRLRQLVFGGVTEHMLFRSNVAALMWHR